MIKHIFVLLLTLMTFSAVSQERNVWYNHITFDVHNLDTSVTFYKRVFQADTIPCPFPSQPDLLIKWLKVGEGVEMHLSQWINNTSQSVETDYKGHVGFVHLGFMVTSMDAFLENLQKVSTDYRTGKYKLPAVDRMPYGARTVMVHDPDGNVIHVIETMPSK
jgi:catechol 2,3-dioxygenase-like lactoylglutathione lyase family enzyme